MAARLSALQAWVTDDLFKPTYNTYQIPEQNVVPSQHPYLLPALRTKQDLLDANQFLAQLQTQAFEPQYQTDYMPQYPTYTNKPLYPTFDLDYNQHSQVDMTPSTGVYPPLFEQSPVPSPQYFGQMGTRLNHDVARQVPQGILQKAPRAGSEELVKELEKMDVDSESKEKVKEEPQVKSEEDDETKAKNLALLKRLQKLVQEMILDQEKEIKKESASTPMENVVPVAAH
jgi:hypothetical protein